MNQSSEKQLYIQYTKGILISKSGGKLFSTQNFIPSQTNNQLKRKRRYLYKARSPNILHPCFHFYEGIERCTSTKQGSKLTKKILDLVKVDQKRKENIKEKKSPRVTAYIVTSVNESEIQSGMGERFLGNKYN